MNDVQCFMVEPIFGEVRAEPQTRYENWDDREILGWCRPGRENDVRKWPSQFGPGAMWFAWDTVKGVEGYNWANETEPHLLTVTPNGYRWDIDSRCNNCESPNDYVHRCWVRTGVAPRITAGKQGPYTTCAAGAGSIFSAQGSPNEWHGFLTDGIFSHERSPRTRFQEPPPTPASILLCTIDRYELTQKCVGAALERAEYPYELLSVDNGSEDRRVVEYIAGLHPVYHRQNPDNQGYARMLNQMLLRATGDYLCVIDNDLMLPQGWLRKLVEVNRAIPESGVSGYHCVLHLNPPAVVGDCEVHLQEEIHGVKFFNRAFLEKVGYFYEAFHVYGNEDVEMNRRSVMAGFKNYYLGAGDRCEHLGNDVAEQSPYRRMKWDSLRGTGHRVLTERFVYFERTGDYYVPPSVATA